MEMHSSTVQLFEGTESQRFMLNQLPQSIQSEGLSPHPNNSVRGPMLYSFQGLLTHTTITLLFFSYPFVELTLLVPIN